MLRTLAAIAAGTAAAAGFATAAVAGKDHPRRPVARYTVKPAVPRAGKAVTFVATRGGCSGCRFSWAIVNKRHRLLRRLGSGRTKRHTFPTPGTRIIRLLVRDRHGHVARRYRSVKIRARLVPPATAPAPIGTPGGVPVVPSTDAAIPVGQPSCTSGAVPVALAPQLLSALRGGQDACVSAPLGDVSLSNIHGAPVHIGTTGAGSLGAIELSGSSGIVFSARMRSIEIRSSDHITIDQSVLGGTPTNRVLDQLVFLPDGADNVTIEDSDLGWTTADDSGNTGYGLRVYEGADNLVVQRNRFHNIGADAIQLGMDGANALIDRNEISYVAPPATSSEHSDDIQVVGNGPNLVITNNYLHDNGLMTADGPQTGGSGPYIHAGSDNSIRFENNLVRDEWNFMQVGHLGTGGCVRSNLTFRRNTFVHDGLNWDGAPDLEWRLCGGSGNLFERNVVNDNFGNDDGFAASGTTADNNLVGSRYTIAADGTCTVDACNPPGQEPIGFRRPSDVPWAVPTGR
jgi:hypothetical protein